MAQTILDNKRYIIEKISLTSQASCSVKNNINFLSLPCLVSISTLNPCQGDQNRLFLKAQANFKPKSGDILSYFFYSIFIIHFHLNNKLCLL